MLTWVTSIGNLAEGRIILNKIMSDTSNQIIKLMLEHMIKNVSIFFAMKL